MTTGVLVLSGSSGRLEEARCAVLREHKLDAQPLRWFGGPGQQPGICEVPLETFTRALDEFDHHDRVALLGTSKTAEAALLVGLRDPRVDAVVAIAPTSVVWANVGPGPDGELRPQRSSWTWRGEPLPFVPYDDHAQPVGDPPSYRPVYEQSLRTYADHIPLARVPVEDLDADLVLVAGGDDAMWPAVPFAEELHERAPRSVLVTEPGAGHRVVLPGEQPLPPSTVNALGGTAEADARLGAKAWPAIATALGL